MGAVSMCPIRALVGTAALFQCACTVMRRIFAAWLCTLPEPNGSSRGGGMRRSLFSRLSG